MKELKRSSCWKARRMAGMTMLYSIVALTLLVGFASLAVDLGRVQLCKTQLQSAADAAVRAAASAVSAGDSAARAAGIAMAAANRADGSPVVLDNSDIELGNWSDGVFSSGGTPTNAVRLRASRTAVKGNAVPLLFASIIGRSSCDVTVTSTATVEIRQISGFIGLNGITVKNNLFSAGYDSALSTNPTESTATNTGMIGSNAAISAKNNEQVGYVVLGPNGSSNLSASASTLVRSTDIPTPAIDFSGAPASNPEGVSQDLSVDGNLTLPGGTYYFTSISLSNNSALSFSGPATVYVDGNVLFSNSGVISGFDNIPGNLVIRQRGAGTMFGGGNANNVDLTADVEAPQTAFSVKNDATLRGRAIFDSITAKNNADLFYDVQLHSFISDSSGASSTGGIALVR